MTGLYLPADVLEELASTPRRVHRLRLLLLAASRADENGVSDWDPFELAQKLSGGRSEHDQASWRGRVYDALAELARLGLIHDESVPVRIKFNTARVGILTELSAA